MICDPYSKSSEAIRYLLCEKYIEFKSLLTGDLSCAPQLRFEKRLLRSVTWQQTAYGVTSKGAIFELSATAIGIAYRRISLTCHIDYFYNAFSLAFNITTRFYCTENLPADILPDVFIHVSRKKESNIALELREGE